MSDRLPMLLLLAVLASVLAAPPPPATAQATATIHDRASRGPSASAKEAMDDALQAFRIDLGGADRGEEAGGAVSGYREINFDDIADADAAPAHLPGDYYATVSPRGLTFESGDPTLTGARGFMVSGMPPAVDPSEIDFGDLNATYPAAFTAYSTSGSAERMFTTLGATSVDVTFTVPHTGVPATVRGFGAVFIDADSSASRLELFDGDGGLLMTEAVTSAPGNEGMSFLGATFGTPVIARARITLGSDATELQGSPNDVTQGGPGDIVVLDNIVYSEPQPLGPADAPPGGMALTELAGVIDVVATGTAEEVRDQIDPLTALFRSAVGHPNNGDAINTPVDGHREVAFDDLAEHEALPSHLPPTYYNSAATRGLVISAEQPLVVSATTPTSELGGLTPGLEAAFVTSEPGGRLLASPGSNRLTLRFFVPGTAVPAATSGLAVVLSDVDLPATTRIEMYDVAGRLVADHDVAGTGADGSLSVFGGRLPSPLVHRVVLTLGSGPVEPGGELDLSQGGSADLVALDRIIYAEPRPAIAEDLLTLEDDGTTLHLLNAADPEGGEELLLQGLGTERLRAIETDPGTGSVYGLGTRDTLFCLDGDGIATPVRILEEPVVGAVVGLDMDSAARRLRVFTSGRQHLSINRFEGSTVALGQLAYGANDPLASRIPAVTAMALQPDGTGWAIDGGNLALWDGQVLRSAGSLGTETPTDTGLERTGTDGLWTILDQGGSGLVRIDTVTGRPARVGDFRARMIDITADSGFGPCPPSPVVVEAEAEVEGRRAIATLTVHNDHERSVADVELRSQMPAGLDYVTLPPPCVIDTSDPDREGLITCELGTLDVDATIDLPVVLGRAGADDEGAGTPLEEAVLTATVRVDGENADHAEAAFEIPPGGFLPPGLRVGDDDVVDTAIELSRLRFDDHDTGPGGRHAPFVVLSRDDAFADSLAGSVLTGDAPLLFTATDSLVDATLTELRRVLGAAGTVYLLGGEVALSPGVAGALTDAGYTVVRLAGASRFETAVQIAAVARDIVGNTDQVLLARAFGPDDNPTAAWADSVSAGGFSAATGSPILLSPTDELHPAVAEYLEVTGTNDTVLLGGPAALAERIEDVVPGPTRVSGDNRAATAAAIATQLWNQQSQGPRAYVLMNAFDERGWPFGLAAAGLAADARAPVLVMSFDVVPPETVEHLDGCVDQPVNLTAVGGSLIDDFLLTLLDSSDTGLC